jgi:hypothetical protein
MSALLLPSLLLLRRRISGVAMEHFVEQVADGVEEVVGAGWGGRRRG